MDIRHEPKSQDTQLVQWLKQNSIPCLPVYTKIDKVSGSIREKNAKLLDAGHTFHAEERVLFSAKTGQGRDQLLAALKGFLSS
jgi:GTP-binding protein